MDAIRSAKGQLETSEERGIQQGNLQAKLEIAKKLIDIHDVATIAKITGLTIAQIEELKKR